jgi:hypothetical protein
LTYQRTPVRALTYDGRDVPRHRLGTDVLGVLEDTVDRPLTGEAAQADTPPTDRVVAPPLTAVCVLCATAPDRSERPS